MIRTDGKPTIGWFDLPEEPVEAPQANDDPVPLYDEGVSDVLMEEQA